MRKASITLYLCLVLCVLLSLISVSFYSARISAGRAVLSCALEEGMFSLFGEYDSELFERYGLMFLDGGRGHGDLQLHKLTKRVEQYASYITSPGRGKGGGRLLSLSEPSASVTGYVLATDGAGMALKRQICTAMKGRIAANAIRLASGSLEEAEQTAGAQQEQMGRNLSDESVSEAEQAAADAIDLGESYADPRETVAAARSVGLLNLVIPAGRTVSGQAVSLPELPSKRALQRGIGGIAQAKSGIADHALLVEYAAEFFPCFSSEKTAENGELQYQLEYLISRKGSDADNLKGTLNRLMLMREASNLAFLSADPVKRAESLAAATAVTTAFGAPYLAPVVAVGIRAAWAYAEGVFDLRRLLAGQKVSLIKTEASWQLSIEQLPVFLSSAGASGTDDEGGFTYEQYLRMLLFTKNDADLAAGLMDLVEESMRHTDGNKDFRIDNCIDAISMELSANAEGKQIKTSEQYGYGMN